MNYLIRRDVLSEAVEKCLDKMYQCSQPPISWQELLQGCKDGKYNDDNPFIYQHYLSMEEYSEIIEEFINAYKIHNDAKDHIGLVLDYLKNGGSKEIYVKPEGFPGHRDYEKVPSLKKIITDIIQTDTFLSGVNETDLINKLVDSVMETVTNCQKFYDHQREENSFRFEVMNYSPDSNKEAVQKFWGDKLTIYDRELDPEDCEWKNASPDQLDEWYNSYLEWKQSEYDDSDYMVQEYEKILKKHGIIQ